MGVMFKFQEIMNGDREHDRPVRERAAELVAAAEESIPHEVLYPAIGAVTEVDAKMGLAIEAVQEDLADLFGDDFRNVRASKSKNPLCRGVYVFAMEDGGASVWDNRFGDAVKVDAACNRIARDAAHRLAVSPNTSLDARSAAKEARDELVSRIDGKLEDAFKDMVGAEKADLESAIAKAHDDIVQGRVADMSDVVEAAARYNQAERLLAYLGDAPLDASWIIDALPSQIDVLESDAGCRAFAEMCVDCSYAYERNADNDLSLLSEDVSEDYFWNDIKPDDINEGVEGLAATHQIMGEVSQDENEVGFDR